MEVSLILNFNFSSDFNSKPSNTRNSIAVYNSNSEYCIPSTDTDSDYVSSNLSDRPVDSSAEIPSECFIKLDCNANGPIFTTEPQPTLVNSSHWLIQPDKIRQNLTKMYLSSVKFSTHFYKQIRSDLGDHLFAHDHTLIKQEAWKHGATVHCERIRSSGLPSMPLFEQFQVLPCFRIDNPENILDWNLKGIWPTHEVFI